SGSFRDILSARPPGQCASPPPRLHCAADAAARCHRLGRASPRFHIHHVLSDPPPPLFYTSVRRSLFRAFGVYFFFIFFLFCARRWR
ncbi:unnamed protein product, partial [Ixodes persulcatus]